MARFLQDARHWQIAALSLLLIYSIAGFDFGASILPSIVALGTCLATQTIASRLAGSHLDLRSPLVTGLSLSLLLRTDALWVTALAAIIAISSKFLFRIKGKHLWNPAAFGIVVVLFGTHHAWTSPGQWGAAVWTATLILFLAILVLGRAGRVDTALAFFGTYGALLLGRAIYLGDPLAIPLHQVETGSLLLFACFMITDPRSTPDRRSLRIGFAVAVAGLAHFLAFEQQMRPALFVALVLLAPVVSLLDHLFPAPRFVWNPSQDPSKGWNPMSLIDGGSARALRVAGVMLGIVATLAVNPAQAFCGFYVAQADAKLFNKASKVVLVRDGSYTAITMASDYEGDPAEFALVVPVPVVVKKDDIHVVNPDLIARLDAYTAPRLTEYFDPDPCNISRTMDIAMPAPAGPMWMANDTSNALDDSGVTIEAKYEVGVYDILILAAKESDGLVAWLKQNHYRIPDGAEDVLGSYIKQSMHFFVANVNLARQAKSATGFLEPIEVSYESAKFMLPIRLGTVNANGPQDMIVYAITRDGRVETANYRPAKMATRVDVPLFVQDDFGPVYKAAFDHAVENDGMHSIFLEYAWSLSAGCDPCSGTLPTPSELATLGARWIGVVAAAPAAPAMPPGARWISVPPAGSAAPTMPQRRVFFPSQGIDGFITRLHVRYDRAHFPEDLLLTETHDQQPFQVVYALHHPFTGPAECKAGEEYRKGLPAQFRQEAANLSDLTGWTESEIRSRMAASGPPVPDSAR